MHNANWILRLFLAAALLAGSVSLTGCETARGFGRDMENLGDAIRGR